MTILVTEVKQFIAEQLQSPELQVPRGQPVANAAAGSLGQSLRLLHPCAFSKG